MEWERARTEEQKEKRIAEIVAATERLYEKYCFEDITFVLIAEEADFTRSNLYKYFSSKEEIFLEFLRQDIEKWRKNLVTKFKSDKDYFVTDFVEIWVNTLVKHKRLLELIAILFSFLEKNTTVESLIEFKLSIKNDLEQLIGLICRIFPDLTEQKAADFVYLQFASAVGLYQMTDHSENQLKAMEHPELKDMKIEFSPYFKNSVEYILRGLLG